MANLEVAIKPCYGSFRSTLPYGLQFSDSARANGKYTMWHSHSSLLKSASCNPTVKKKVLWLDLRRGFLFLCVLARYISDEHFGAQINGTSHAPNHISNSHIRELCTRLFVRTSFLYFLSFTLYRFTLPKLLIIFYSSSTSESW